jgi:hypothetical protein
MLTKLFIDQIIIMKKIYILFILCLAVVLKSKAQTVIDPTDELILPQYAYYGPSATAASRAPVVVRVTLRGLAISTTYRYISGLSSTNNISTTGFAPGGNFRVNNGTPHATFGNIVGYTTQKFGLNGSELSGDLILPASGTTNYHSRFTTDIDGNYTGWFIVVPVGQTTQQILGSDVFFYVNLCLNSSPSFNPTVSYRTTNTIKLLDYTTDNTGLSPLVGTTSNIGNEKLVSLYDNVDGTGRPLATTYTEAEGINITSLSTWYTGNVEGSSGKWGTVIPNNTAVKAIRFFNAGDGTEIVVGNGTGNKSANGIWNSVSTIINTGTTSTPVTINSIAPTTLPISLSSFTGTAKDFGVGLNWTTASEINNQYFEILKAGDDRNFVSIGKVNGSGNSSETKTYSFLDFNPLTGNNYYQLKQVDLDGKSSNFGPVVVNFGLSSNSFNVLSTSESSVTVNISSSETQQAELSYIGLDGRMLYRKSISLANGLNTISIPVDKSTGSIGIISLKMGSEQRSIKVAR